MKTETRIIRGLEVKCTQLPALRGFELLTTVRDLDPHGMNLRAAVINVPSGMISQYALKFLVGASVIKDGASVQLDSVDRINGAFGGDAAALIQAMIFALEVNLASFLDAVDESTPSTAADDASNPTPTS